MMSGIHDTFIPGDAAMGEVVVAVAVLFGLFACVFFLAEVFRKESLADHHKHYHIPIAKH